MYCPSVAVMKESPKGGMKLDGHFIPEGTAISVCCKISIIFCIYSFDNFLIGLSGGHAHAGQVL